MPTSRFPRKWRERSISTPRQSCSRRMSRSKSGRMRAASIRLPKRSSTDLRPVRAAGTSCCGEISSGWRRKRASTRSKCAPSSRTRRSSPLPSTSSTRSRSIWSRRPFSSPISSTTHPWLLPCACRWTNTRGGSGGSPLANCGRKSRSAK